MAFRTSVFYNKFFAGNIFPYECVLLADSAIVLASGYLAYLLETPPIDFVCSFWPSSWGLLFCLAVYITFFRVFHTYSNVIRFSTINDLERIMISNCLAVVSILVVRALYNRVAGPAMQRFFVFPVRLILAEMFILATGLMWVERMVIKKLYRQISSERQKEKAFIYGVKDGGISLAKSIINQTPQQYELLGFVSGEKDLEDKYILGIKVYNDIADLPSIMRKRNAGTLFIAPLCVDEFRESPGLADKLLENGIRLMMMPGAEEWDGKSALHHEQMHEMKIDDLLPRQKISVDMAGIEKLLKDKAILITGAAGSIGSEIVRQVARFNPSRLILIDQAETPMHDLRLYLTKNFPWIDAETIVASITDKAHMESIFDSERPEYVFHAAAYKHVPMMEDNPAQAVRNNVAGTRIVADLAVKYGVKKFVMISTDKAVNPTNVMGCSKRICELYCQSLSRAISEGRVEGVTQFITTRFGNVLGSNGSVIPIFREQIRNGGPVTVTHPDIIRYFMLISEACNLVLEACTLGSAGEIFVFDMGEPVKIVDLARRMIKLSGAGDIEIKFTGLRDGEKLYEEVLKKGKENTLPTKNPMILVARSSHEYAYSEMLELEEELMRLTEGFDDMSIVRQMKKIVPEFKSMTSKYEVLD